MNTKAKKVLKAVTLLHAGMLLEDYLLLIGERYYSVTLRSDKEEKAKVLDKLGVFKGLDKIREKME